MRSARQAILTRIEDVEPLAREFCQLSQVKAVLLFGSHARGQPNALSDIDLCVLGPLGEPERTEILAHSSDNLHISFFRDLPISIRFRVIQEGRPLAVTNRDYFEEETSKTIQEYLDFKPVLDHYAREVLRVQR